MPSNKLKDLPKRKAVRSTKGSREPDDGHADLAGLVQYRVHGVAREGRVVDGATVVCSPDGKNWARGNGFGEVEGGFGSEDARVEAREDGEVGFRNGVVSLGGGSSTVSGGLGQAGGIGRANFVDNHRFEGFGVELVQPRHASGRERLSGGVWGQRVSTASAWKGHTW